MARAAALALALLLASAGAVAASRLDGLVLGNGRAVPDRQLEFVLRTSADWLQFRAKYLEYPLLATYAEQLQRLARPACTSCFDYFEAVAALRTMGKLISQILRDDKNDVHYPVLRRSYVAAVWTLQRSRMFVWETTHLQSNALSTMFRMYLHHVKRSKGRAVSFHHISKCGGTTMCQLAASNRCANPYLNQEKNCVLSSRLDGPIWMLAHDVTPDGAFLNATRAVTDVAPPPDANSALRAAFYTSYATEPRSPMWLMYSCPYEPHGRPYTCAARAAHVTESGTTFVANERTLSTEYGIAQVCPEFLNAVILREPVPHVVSLLAEAKYRYVRQLRYKHHISEWEPPAWNLTWWKTFGPALVGNYATRTLMGRDAFCRSASNMAGAELAEAVDALLSFDVVMTLGRSREMDLLISTLLGWPAQNFTSQPKARVRDESAARAAAAAATPSWLAATGIVSGSSISSSAIMSSHSAGGGDGAAELPALSGVPTDDYDASDGGSSSSGAAGGSLQGGAPAGPEAVERPVQLHARHLLQDEQEDYDGDAGGRDPDRYDSGYGDDAPGGDGRGRHADAGTDDDEPERGEGAGDAENDEESMFEAAAAELDLPFEEAPPPPPLPPEVLAEQSALALVRDSWLERRAQALGFANVTAARDANALFMISPAVVHTGRRDADGSHVITVTLTTGGLNESEVWHAFPRHAFAFTAADMEQLRRLTRLDAQLVEVADVLLDLDAAWIGVMLGNHHYKKKMKLVASTYSACGFAGMMPLTETVHKHIFR